MLVKEEGVLNTTKSRLDSVFTIITEFSKHLPIDTSFLNSEVLEDLPNKDILLEGESILRNVEDGIKNLSTKINKLQDDANIKFNELKERWRENCKKAQENYDKALRELQESNVDGDEFIKLKQQIETLRPLREKKNKLQQEISIKQSQRKGLIDELQNIQAEEYRALEKAAKRVSRKLSDRVRVKVQMAGNRKPLEQFLRDEIGGNLAALIDRLNNKDQLSLLDLAEKCREGKDFLIKDYNLPTGAAERLANAGEDLYMKIEELELPPTTAIELNTASENNEAHWQSLDELSTGQKATAILLLLLLESEAPLVVDQPEDDLDNRFVTDGVVPIMKREKRKRQFIFSTHNANIPVLGDAELIVGLSAGRQNDSIKGLAADPHMGSIDIQSVREMVEEILEGGKTAFEMRREKYGF